MDFGEIRRQVVEATATQRGFAYAQALMPEEEFATAEREQKATAALREIEASAEFAIGRAIDTAEVTQRAAAGSTLAPADLRAVADALAAASAAYNKTHGLKPVQHITAGYAKLLDLERALANAIDERGNVLDRASPALGRIRKSLAGAQVQARERMSALVRSSRFSSAIQDPVVTIRGERFVIPVKAEFAAAVRGIVHDTSASGQTLFIEPLEALEINNRVRSLRIEEERETQRVLAELSKSVGAQAAQIEANVEMLARLDVVAAKAHLAARMDAAPPELVSEPVLEIDQGRHPLLGGRAVPQSLLLNEETRIILISGPNMGGKTVSLKMAGLFVLMAYSGMQLPVAAGTRIGRFDAVFADIGDEQSIAQNTSTFSAHLARMREAITAAGPAALILVDEIGGGTEPSSGAALAVALLERLLRSGAHAIATTHSTELKLFAHETEGVLNANVRFDPKTFRPTYELLVGTPGQSLAFPLARTLGIPGDVLDRADELLGTQERRYEQALAELSSATAEMQARRESLERENKHLESLQANLRSRADSLERTRRELLDKAESRLRAALREFAASLNQKVTRSQAELLERTLAQMRRDIGMKHEVAPADESPQTKTASFGAGDRVRSLSLGAEGTVVSDNGDSVLVGIGSMKTLLPKADLRKVAAAKPRSGSDGGDIALASASRMMPELDIRGKRFMEAQPLLERWIDDAIVSGNSPLRIIHGKGTGLLGKGVQEYLREHPAVHNVRFGNADEGGGGVTIFELR